MSITLETISTAATTQASTTAFHVTLCVADLGRSVRFYEILLGKRPSLYHGNYARFELDKPALVIVLYAASRPPGGTLSHVGLRVRSSEELVEIQQRLEASGIATQREEGVECCYARQTKFWVTDPDRVLWELYILHDDLDHSGFDDHPNNKQPAAPSAVWMHRLMEPLPERIPAGDGSQDEVRLEGTFNIPIEPARRTDFLTEIQRVLRPGGRLVIHGLLCDRPFPGEPKLPGLASLVKYIPTEQEIEHLLHAAGFESLFYETLSDVNCIDAPGVELRHGLLVGLRGAATKQNKDQAVVYRGPFAQVCDEHGTVYPRGERIAVTAVVAAQLKQGPAADQFAFLVK
ncbi:ArsI/CadI family heavy metal resistance metalloenzyme [Anatilimnocola floriformis]|uniref:ArsI/CadI family heavy metal resistance metalloenzyme n=1 Tax=Anatilimnocola floriformis TaxID=2948575 RepID=UPI0020C46955|nr:ArsI/CadI family heavy metal resistance metalloenzyme [Anatilimnocola floriformis]